MFENITFEDGAVDGLFLSAEQHDQTPIVPIYRDLDFSRGFLQIEAVSDGTNPYIGEAGAWTAYILRTREDDLQDGKEVDGQIFFPIGPYDTVHKVIVSEKTGSLADGSAQQFGLWLDITFERPNFGNLLFPCLLKPYEYVALTASDSIRAN